MFLAALNLFPIPYQAYMTLSLVGLGWLTFESVLIASYVAGAAMGTFIMLYVYIFFFEKIRSSVWVTQRNMNYFIGIITGAVAVITLINIIKDL